MPRRMSSCAFLAFIRTNLFGGGRVVYHYLQLDPTPILFRLLSLKGRMAAGKGRTFSW